MFWEMYKNIELYIYIYNLYIYTHSCTRMGWSGPDGLNGQNILCLS